MIKLDFGKKIYYKGKGGFVLFSALVSGIGHKNFYCTVCLLPLNSNPIFKTPAFFHIFKSVRKVSFEFLQILTKVKL